MVTVDARLTRILALSALGDVLVGLVLLALGQSRDSQGLSLGGLVLLVVGAGVLAVVAIVRNRPTKL